MWKKLLMVVVPLFSSFLLHAQSSDDEVLSYGNGELFYYSVENVPTRLVNGGGVIQIKYVGDQWENNADRKSALEYACKIWEERLPTSLPILIEARFGKMSAGNVLAKTAVTMMDNLYLGCSLPKACAKRHLQYGFPLQTNLVNDDNFKSFISAPDAVITFSDADVFSFSLDFVKESKYDFVTVALREFSKVFGMYANVRNSQNTLLVTGKDGVPNLYTNAVLDGKWINPGEAYTYATSGRVKLNGKSIYSPSQYSPGNSLNYFVDDSNDKETSLLQMTLPKGTSIRNVDNFIIEALCYSAGWQENSVVGTEGTTTPPATGNQADNVLPYNKEIYFSPSGASLTNAMNLQSEMESATSTNTFYSLSLNEMSSFEEYRSQFLDYPDVTDYDTYNRAWTVSVLKKDGTWDVIKKSPYFLGGMHFSTSELDSAKADQYARSCDGSLRCRASLYDNLRTPTTQSCSRHFLLSYLPQKPVLASTRNFSLPANAQATRLAPASTRSAGVYEDVKVSFKNVEGTEHLTAEILEEGATVPYKYNMDDCIKQGYFIASVDKQYATEIQLLATNKNGMTESEVLRIELPKPINIFVKTVTGKKIPLVVYRDDTVADVKNLLYEKEGIPIDQQRLIFAGKELKDTQKLSECRISEGSIISIYLM